MVHRTAHREQGPLAVLKSDRAFRPVLASCIGLFMGYNLNITYMIQTVTARGGTSGDMGAVFAIAAALELPAMTLAGRLLRSRSAGTLMFCSGLGLTAKSLVIALSGGLAGVYAAQFLQPLGYALVIPCTVYYANRAFPPHRRLAGQSPRCTQAERNVSWARSCARCSSCTRRRHTVYTSFSYCSIMALNAQGSMAGPPPSCFIAPYFTQGNEKRPRQKTKENRKIF